MKNQDTVAALPNDPTAERALLGSFLMEPNLLTAAAPQIQTDAFHNPVNGWIYDAMNGLRARNTPIDFITLQNELEQRGILREVGGPAYLTELALSTPTSIHWQNYLDIINAKARRRAVIATASELAIAAYDETADVEAVAADATTKLRPTTTKGKGLRPIKEALEEVVNRAAFLEENPDALAGIPTTFNAIDLMLGGLKRQDLIYLAGRPSMGKSALAINIVMQQALRWPEMQIAVFTLEMSSASQASRMVANKGSIESNAIQRGRLMADDWENMMKAANQIAATGIYIDDTPGYSPEQIHTHCEAHKERYGLDLVVIDYIGLMSRPANLHRNANTQEGMTAISKALKDSARKLNVPMLALSQLSRAVESRADKRPMMSDLRESGALEQDADVVLFVYRDDYYNKDSQTPGVTEVIVGKQRNGEIGTANLFFVKHLQRFTDLVTIRQELTY